MTLILSRVHEEIFHTTLAICDGHGIIGFPKYVLHLQCDLCRSLFSVSVLGCSVPQTALHKGMMNFDVSYCVIEP